MGVTEGGGGATVGVAVDGNGTGVSVAIGGVMTTVGGIVVAVAGGGTSVTTGPVPLVSPVPVCENAEKDCEVIAAMTTTTMAAIRNLCKVRYVAILVY